MSTEREVWVAQVQHSEYRHSWAEVLGVGSTKQAAQRICEEHFAATDTPHELDPRVRWFDGLNPARPRVTTFLASRLDGYRRYAYQATPFPVMDDKANGGGPASSLAVALLREHVESGGTVEAPSLGITITKEPSQ